MEPLYPALEALPAADPCPDAAEDTPQQLVAGFRDPVHLGRLIPVGGQPAAAAVAPQPQLRRQNDPDGIRFSGFEPEDGGGGRA
jgi:hypothetical protein